MMYTVSTRKNVVAQHYLPNEEGLESQKHSHSYQIVIALSGETLNMNGYLVNLLEVEEIFEENLHYFRDKTLNDLKEFKELHPSIENFAKIFCSSFIKRMKVPSIRKVCVKIWENEESWASYEIEV